MEAMGSAISACSQAWRNEAMGQLGHDLFHGHRPLEALVDEQCPEGDEPDALGMLSAARDQFTAGVSCLRIDDCR
jgi:hypothetical protein